MAQYRYMAHYEYNYPEYVLERAGKTYGLAAEIDALQVQLNDTDTALREIIKETLLKDTVSVIKSTGSTNLLDDLSRIYGRNVSSNRPTMCRIVKNFWGGKQLLVVAAMNRIDESKMVIDRNDYLKIMEKVDRLDSEDASITEIKKMLEAMNA